MNYWTSTNCSKLDFVQKYDGWIVRKAVQNQTRRRGILPRCNGTGNRY